MEHEEVDAILRHLVQLAAHQGTINDDLREFIRQQMAINRDTQITLARVETLLARMIRQGDNGRDT